MAKIYFTLTGTRHYFGDDFLKKGMRIELEKEPDNKYDREAIMVKVKGLGKDRLCGKQYLYRAGGGCECRPSV